MRIHKCFLTPFALLICLCLSLSLLSGCAAGRPDTSQSKTTTTSVPDSQSDADVPPVSQPLRQVVYGGIAAYINTPYQLGMTGDTVWAFGDWNDAGASRQNLFVRMDAGTFETSCLPLQLPAPTLQAGAGQCVLQSVSEVFLVAEDALLVLLEERLIDHAQDDSDEYYAAMQHPLEILLTVCTVTPDGAVQRAGELQLPAELQPRQGVQVGTLWNGSFSGTDGDLRLAMFCGQELPDGSVSTADTFLLRVAADGSCKSCTPLSDGSLDYGAPLLRADDSAVYLQQDIASGTTWWLTVEGLSADTPKVSRQPAAEELRPGAWQAVWQPDGALPLWWGLDGVCLLPEDTGAPETVLRWSDHGLAGATIYGVFFAGGDELLVAAATQEDGFAFYRLKTEGAPLAGQPVVTFAIQSDYYGTLQAAVDAYNYSEPAYRIQTVDYSFQAAQAAGFSSGAEMLVHDILNNTAPDILQLSSNMGVQQWVRQGLFIDLYPFLDADGEVSRDDLLANVLAACEQEGALPTLMASFAFCTVAASDALLGAPATGWDPQQFAQLCAGRELALFPYDRAYALELFVLLSGRDFIDYAGGQCHLDQPAFVSLLEQSAGWSAEGTDDTQQDPKAAFTGGTAGAYAADFGPFRRLKAMRYVLDGDFSFVGMPTDSGAGGNALRPDLWLGVTRYCQNPDAAWAFLRTLLLAEYQSDLSFGLPVRQDALQAQAAAASAPITRMEELGYYPPYLQNLQLSEQQQSYWLQGCEETDVARLLDAIQSTATLYLYDSTVRAILFEEAEAYYAGQRTAEEAAAIMQNRVQTYLDEQG